MADMAEDTWNVQFMMLPKQSLKREHLLFRGQQLIHYQPQLVDTTIFPKTCSPCYFFSGYPNMLRRKLRDMVFRPQLPTSTPRVLIMI